jgi:hypothetical protein
MKLFFISNRIVFHISYAHTPNPCGYNGLEGFNLDIEDLQTDVLMRLDEKFITGFM